MMLVAGATGLVGGMITRSLVQQGQAVRILVRPGSGYQPLIEMGAEVVFGDLKDPDSLVPACVGVDMVITTATAGQRGGTDTPETVDLAGSRNLIDASRKAGVRQLVFISTIAADERSPIPVFRAKAQAEAYLRTSGLPYTIVTAATLMDILLPLVVGGPAHAGRPVVLVGTGSRRHSFIAAADLAAFAVAVADHPAALNRRIIVGGPDPVSLRDVVAAYERVLGHRTPIETIAPGALVPNLPPVPGLAETVSGMLAVLDTFDSPIDMTETARTFGVHLTSLEDFARREVAGVPTARASL